MHPSSPSAPAAHPLDNVVWSALASHQAALAEGDDAARRYLPAYAWFAAVADPARPRLDALARVMRPDERVSLVLPHPVEPDARFDLVARKLLVQMLGPSEVAAVDESRFVVLGPGHKARMAALIKRTEPGPWMARSDELGRFLGVFEGDELVAMAGERMHLPGYREVSGVCTDPAWRGRGYARDLMLAVARAILARGERPFLHVLAENAVAIALYERLGFVQRARMHITGLRRNDVPPA